MATRRERWRAESSRQLVGKALATVVVASTGAVALSSLAFPGPASAVSSSGGKTFAIKTVHVAKIGTVLATNAGLTLYRYTVDPTGEATCTGACAKVWPPLLLPKGVTRIKAPHGVKGFSVIHATNGRLQVSFRGEALYAFASDTKKGQATGQGVESDWFAVLSNGKSSGTSLPATGTSTPAAGSASTATTSNPTPATSTPQSNAGAKSTPTTVGHGGSTSPPATNTTSPPVTTTPPTTPPAPTTTTTAPRPSTTTTTAPPAGAASY